MDIHVVPQAFTLKVNDEEFCDMNEEEKKEHINHCIHEQMRNYYDYEVKK